MTAGIRLDVPELDFQRLRPALAAASDTLFAERKRIDALNVYPVPDGDTGSNMAGTLREAVASLDQLRSEERRVGKECRL